MAVAALMALAAMFLASCESGHKSTDGKSACVGADTLFYHRLRGDLYKIAGKERCPNQLNRLTELTDSARLTSPDTAHSVTVSDSDGTPYALGIGLPYHFDRNRSYPLIIYLHGGIGTDISTKGERAWEMLGGLRDSIDVIIASPSGNRFAQWWTPRGMGRIIHAVRYVNTVYNIVPGKIFLAGVSDGATGCYAFASAAGGDGPFAGFFAVSGFGGMLPRLGVRLSIDNLRKRPIYNVNGGKDRLYPIEAVNGFIEYLRGEGVPVTNRTYPDEEHGFDYREREYSELAERIRGWSSRDSTSR
ncbi:MAG: dienelactone hydrolase family protein [Chitinispirillales bacterium]|jgi:predicted peptidase|nr:dienelactone hydrolase family protein [Chitinispirillales bacterium]